MRGLPLKQVTITELLKKERSKKLQSINEHGTHLPPGGRTFEDIAAIAIATAVLKAEKLERSQRSEDHLRDLDQDVLKIEEVIKVVFNNLIVVKRNMA